MDRNKTLIKILIAVNIVLLLLIFLFAGIYFVNKSYLANDEQKEEEVVQATPTPVTEPQEINTIKEFLKNALKPVGNTMYVYGGGWNKEDTGAGETARTIGVAPQWQSFYHHQDSSYDSSKYRYHIEKGLDCSGYVGWAVYNTLEDENMQPGYVFLAQEFADKMSALGLGEKISKENITNYKPGDIMSSKSDEHVWIVVGECDDGSIVLLNSSPPGVTISGTVSPLGNQNSEAVQIAKKYLCEAYDEWYSRYSYQVKPMSYLTNYDQFRWYTDGRTDMRDTEGYYNKKPDEIIDELLRNK